jgi:hypothetical protein
VTLEPLPGFDWNRVKWSGPTAPVEETCSYCDAAIDDDVHYIPLRLWSTSAWAAVFCEDCMVMWFGFSRQVADPETFP